MNRVRSAWHTFSGLITLSDLMGTLGFWLYRGTLRRTLLFGIGLIAMAMADKKTDLVNLGLSTKAAIGTTSIIFAVSCIGGALLMFVGGSFSKSALLLGEAKGGNLLEDMKKDRQPIHRANFWKRVIRYERDIHPQAQIEAEVKLIEENQDDLTALRSSAARQQFSQARLIELEGILARLGLTRTGWDLAFDQGMALPLPRSMLKHQFRYDLSKLKDWYDGAPFHHTDTKLQQQFDAAESLHEAKRRARVSRLFLLTHTRKRMFQKLWFRVISRAIQLRVARACRQLDKDYPPFHFSIDQFLWPHDLTDDLIRRQVGQQALEDLIDLRQRIFQRVLTPEPELAQRLMHRAIYPNFEGACQLRRLFDPQYVLDELEETWSEDLVRYNRAFTPREREAGRRRLFIQRTRKEQESLSKYLADHPEHEGAADPEAKRALRIAMHIDHEGLKTLLAGGAMDRPWSLRAADFLAGRSPVKPTKALPQIIEEVIAERRHMSSLLVAVRMHHELTRNELEDYEFYLGRIMGREVRTPDAAT